MSRPTPAVIRAASVLNLLADHPTQTFTLTDIIRSLRMSRASCHAILAALVRSGYVYRSTDKSYRLGPAFIRIHRQACEAPSPLQAALPEVQRLANQFDAICSLVFLEREELVVRERALGPSHLGWAMPSDRRIPFKPPVGILFIAWAGKANVRQWLGGEAGESDEQVNAAIAFAREYGFVCGYRHDGKLAAHDMKMADYPRFTAPEIAPLDPGRDYAVAYIAAPVRDAASNVAFCVVLTGLTRSLSGADLQRTGETLRERCAKMSWVSTAKAARKNGRRRAA